MIDISLLVLKAAKLSEEHEKLEWSVRMEIAELPSSSTALLMERIEMGLVTA